MLSRMGSAPELQRLVPRRTLLLVVDVQERLAAAMPSSRMADLVRAARILLGAAQLLGARAVATEHYAKGLGPTLREVAESLDAASAPRVPKVCFSALGAGPLVDAIEAHSPETVIVFGMEAHVCVYQSVRDLRARGYRVQVPADAVVSRRDDHREIGLSLCERAGAVITTAETIAFDWLEQAGTPEFKSISALIR
jgi:nicotinamidase-related amidase